MLGKSFGLHFYLKKPKNYVKGIIPIYLRITGSNRWNSAAERPAGTKEDSRALTAYLDTLQAKAYEAKRQLIETNKMVTAISIKDGLLGNGREIKCLLKSFRNIMKGTKN